jgi:hypothetical protein
VLAVLLAAALAGVAAAQPSPQRPTFNEVAPIIYARCSSCHRPGQSAPFSLLTYDDVKLRAQRMALVTKQRSMPPWPPEPGFGEFANARVLSDAEIDLIQRWVSEGAPEGDQSALPKPPTWLDDWQLGRPDVVLELPQPYTLPAAHGDVFRSFVVPIPGAMKRYVRGVEFRPVNPRVVHHVVMRFDRTGTARRLDESDPEPGYDGMLSAADESPSGRFLGWTPGKTPTFEREGMAWPLYPQTDAVINAHLMPTDKPELVQFQIGLFFTDNRPVADPVMLRLGSELIDIAAGEKDYPVNARYMLPVDVDVLSVYPHAHYLAKDMKAFAVLPDGSVKWLVWIKDWNFNWQDVYVYASPIHLPRGTLLSMRYTYDNSADNIMNPNRPPRQVTYGPRSSDEMADLWLQVMPRNAADAAVLEQDRLR